MHLKHSSERVNPASLSYFGMRKGVGMIATALPFVLAGGNILFPGSGGCKAFPHSLFQESISAYYYTDMRNFLVGSLCAIAIFSIGSHGYDFEDKIAGHLVGIFALGVAFFPTANPADVPVPPLEQDISNVHLVSAALMFLTLAYFCLVLFRKKAPSRRPTRRKLQRNVVYSVCGWTIVGSMAVMVSLNIPVVQKMLQGINPLFWFESLSILAFGVAWLTKGEAILKDKTD